MDAYSWYYDPPEEPYCSTCGSAEVWATCVHCNGHGYVYASDLEHILDRPSRCEPCGGLGGRFVCSDPKQHEYAVRRDREIFGDD